jgi:hypothetical protein
MNKNIEPILGNINYTLVNGIIKGVYIENSIIDLAIAKEVVKKRILFSNRSLSPLLIDGRKVKQVTKEARDYFGSKEGAELLSAGAILVESKLTTILANFMVRINISKSYIPLKVFSKEEDAIDWLKKYV